MSQNDHFLRMLQQAGSRGVFTNELAGDGGVGVRWSARKLDLRKRGYDVRSERVGQGRWRYWLERERPKSGAGLSGAAHTAPDLGEQSLSGRDSSSAHRVDGGSAGSPLSRPESDEQLFDTPKPKTHRGYGDMEAA